MAPTGVAAINIDGTTIHTGLGIPCKNFIPLSDKQRTALWLKLEDVSVIFIDEISMVGSKLLLKIHQRLCKSLVWLIVFHLQTKLLLPVVIFINYPLYPVFSTEGFVIALLKLWHNFKFVESDEVMRQQGDNRFIEQCENRLFDWSRWTNPQIKICFAWKPDYPWNALHIYAENFFVGIHNQRMLVALDTQQRSLFKISI